MKSFTWDGTETGLYDLLIWWGTVEPFEHNPGCDPEMRDRTLDCCMPEEPIGNALLGGGHKPAKHGEPFPLYFQFFKAKNAGKKYDMHPGDTIFYEDGKFSYKESFECVVISQDWP